MLSSGTGSRELVTSRLSTEVLLPGPARVPVHVPQGVRPEAAYEGAYKMAEDAKDDGIPIRSRPTPATMPRGPDPELLKLLGFWGQRKISRKFEHFFKKHAHIFDKDCRIGPGGSEQRLEYTECYNAYQALYEEVLGGFIREQGMDQSEFMERCTVAMESEGTSIDKQILRAIMAGTDYVSFVRMMADTKALQNGYDFFDSESKGEDRPLTPPTAPSTPRDDAKGGEGDASSHARRKEDDAKDEAKDDAK